MKYVVVDLEFCKVPKSCRRKEYRHSNETIQIGAVILDEELKVTEKFSIFVHPEYGFIDSHIRELTGITHRDVKDAPTMSEALRIFSEWIPDEEVGCVCWSNSDYNQIVKEMEAKCIDNEKILRVFEYWIDAQEMFNKKIANGRNFSLREAVIASDIVTDVREHNGLDDAYNTALIFAKMTENPDFAINEIYEAAVNNDPEPLNVCLGDLFMGLNLQLAV